MTKPRYDRTSRSRAAVFGCMATVALFTGSAVAQTLAQPPAPGPVPTQGQAAPPPSMPAAPSYRPGLFDAFGRWMEESTAGFNTNLNATWGEPPGKGMSDAAKGAAEATKGAADAMSSAARETAGALSRLPTSRVVIGRERCTIAHNGAPDCRVAAAALCKANGYASGSSVDFETTELCPSGALMARWRGEPVTCTTENYVTRSLCQ
jgi:hypothetical protein